MIKNNLHYHLPPKNLILFNFKIKLINKFKKKFLIVWSLITYYFDNLAYLYNDQNWFFSKIIVNYYLLVNC